MQDFHRLDVWRKAHELVVMLYRSTSRAPEPRFPGLASQMRRAGSSIPANIAEGCGHASRREFARFLQHALASGHELQYHLLLAKDLQLLPSADYARLDARADQVNRMLTGLLRKVRSTADGDAARSKTRRTG